jgi:hypothetical protein
LPAPAGGSSSSETHAEEAVEVAVALAG